jgi:hypothetical protein
MTIVWEDSALDELAEIWLRVHGTPLPSDVYQRIRDRGDKLREEMRQEYGAVEIAVDLIREIRDKE